MYTSFEVIQTRLQQINKKFIDNYKTLKHKILLLQLFITLVFVCCHGGKFTFVVKICLVEQVTHASNRKTCIM